MMIGEAHFRCQRFFILAAVLQIFMMLGVLDAHAQPQTKSEREAGEEIVAVYLGAAPELKTGRTSRN